MTCVIVLSALFLALARSADLPPHFVELGYGTLTCERGYLLKAGERIAFRRSAEEISTLPPAGEGSRQPRSARPVALDMVCIDVYQ